MIFNFSFLISEVWRSFLEAILCCFEGSKIVLEQSKFLKLFVKKLNHPFQKISTTSELTNEVNILRNLNVLQF